MEISAGRTCVKKRRVVLGKKDNMRKGGDESGGSAAVPEGDRRGTDKVKGDDKAVVTSGNSGGQQRGHFSRSSSGANSRAIKMRSSRRRNFLQFDRLVSCPAG